MSRPTLAETLDHAYYHGTDDDMGSVNADLTAAALDWFRERLTDPETVGAVGEALEDAALSLIGTDLGTVYRDDIARAALSAVADLTQVGLPVPTHYHEDGRRCVWSERDGWLFPRPNGLTAQCLRQDHPSGNR